MTNAFFAYRVDEEGWYSVAFHSGKKYARGFDARKMFVDRCRAAAERKSEETYAVVDLETLAVTDLHGAILRDQIEAVSDYDLDCYRENEEWESPKKIAKPDAPDPPVGETKMVYAMALEKRRSLLDIAQRVCDTEVLPFRFPHTSFFYQRMQQALGRFNTQQVRRGSLDRFVLVEFPEHLGLHHAGPVAPF